jgi:hypothetical protein
MSVVVEYGGRFGNHVFQYTCGRIFAMENGLKLLTKFDGEGILSATPHEDGVVCGDPAVRIDAGHPWAYSLLDEKRPPAKYVLSWHFQRGKWYHSRHDLIRKFLVPVRPLPTEKNSEDIVANFRLGDYLPPKFSIHPEWFLGILEKEKFGKLHIVADEYNDRYFSYFKRYNPLIHIRGAVEDWYYLQKFDRVICPNSTFSWWAAFFSNASKIYVHKRWLKLWPEATLGWFPNGIQVDGPFIDEKAF